LLNFINKLKNLKEYILIRRSGLFDPYYYYQHYPDVRRADTNPLMHYISYGWKEGRNPSELFDTNFYLSQNKDVRNAGGNPLIHYLNFGRIEGRDPMPHFSDKNGRSSTVDNLIMIYEHMQNHGLTVEFIGKEDGQVQFHTLVNNFPIVGHVLLSSNANAIILKLF
jgi:hypothetical protein